MFNHLILILALLGVLVSSPAAQQTDMPEAISPLGAKFYALADGKGAVAEAEAWFAKNPKNLETIMALGHAQAAIWRYRDAITSYTMGMELAPNDAMLYRYRGHRYISTRRFDKAVEDLEKAAKLNDKNFDIWYHLGLAHYLRGEFAKAADAYEKCHAVAEKDDSKVAVADWLYMTYRRLKKEAEAKKVLEGITPDMQVVENKSYFSRLLFYKGLKKESEIFDLEKMTHQDIATVGYGIGNWYLYNGNSAKAKEYFQKIVATTYWPAFGFIAAETELARMASK